MALTRVFDIARRSLSTYQYAMNIAAHNISNAGNENYSRQRASLSTVTPEKNAGFIWGAGIKMDSIQRIRDGIIERQILTNQQSYSNNYKQSQVLSQVEGVFSEPSELGISNLMNQFFNNWNELSVTPNSVPLRNNVIYAAQNLSNKVASVNQDIDTIKYDIYKEFQQSANNVNSYLKQLNQLNQQIYSFTGINQQPNDLLDTRDSVIQQLSKLVNTTVTYDNSGNAAVSIGGAFAVDGHTYTEFEVRLSNDKITLAPVGGDNPAKLSGGEMAAMAEIYNNKIPSYKNDLDNIFSQFVTQVNAIHQSGWTIEDTPRSNIKFFKEYTNGKLVIDNEILNDPKNIAVSADGTNGNGDIAVKLFELSEAKNMSGTTFGNFYSSLMSKLGNDNSSITNMTESSKLVLSQLENQRASVSGVSVDEEMTEIIKFQKAYEASAKLISVSNEMLDTLINLV
ncbi:MAG: flagellar hook-associated protein FlgK [Ignavibacteriae bacterium HGW-Ignavibacteriae-2]|nr:MAG: flagellar hook-associated protein FlgK [Ignavibacteriae bacterium HGW-Ignavibacteriae-2]